MVIINFFCILILSITPFFIYGETLCDSITIENFEDYYIEEIEECLINNNSINQNFNLNYILSIAHIQKDYLVSEKHANIALELSNNNIDSIKVFNQLSYINRKQNKASIAIKKALLAYNLSIQSNDYNLTSLSLLELLKTSRSLGDSVNIVRYNNELNHLKPNILDNNILSSIIYQTSKTKYYGTKINKLSLTKIINNLKEALSLTNKLNLKGDILEFLALCHLHQEIKDFEKAKTYHISSIKLKEQANNKRSIAISYLNFCNLLSEQYYDFEAIEYCKIAINQAEKISAYDILESSYWNIAYLYSENDNYNLAYQNLNKHIEYKDILIEKENKKYALDLQTQYQTKETEQENKLLAQRLIYSLIALVFFLLALGIISLLFRRTNKLNKIITNQNQELEKLNSFKNQLFSIMGHDMRGMMSKLNLSQRKVLRTNHKEGNESLEKPISKMGAIIDGLNGFIENILYWGFTQTDKLHFNFETLNVNQILDQVLLNFKYDLEAKELEIIKKVDADFSILADINTTKVVLRNLISNAIKFSKNGDNLKIDAEENQAFHIIKIIDQGKGISKEILPYIFETNPEKINDGTMGEKGTGLGLWLCQEMMEKNQGKISVESEEGKGTCFILQFPKPHS